jgi:type II secretory pathway pseudopilin PulG
MCHNSKTSAFTLVELAIVIVIIGLLVGGVLQGQALIHAAKMSKLASNMESYQAAITMYKGKYLFFPGDNPRAYLQLGHTGCTNTVVTSANPTGCNGNANGTTNNIEERFRGWQALSVEKLIKGTYTGLAGPLSNTHIVAGENMPGTVYSNTVVAMSTGSAQDGYVPTYTIRGGTISAGLVTGPTTSFPLSPFITPEEMYMFDIKFDDGKPSSGAYTGVHRPYYGNENCIVGTDLATAVYNLEYKGIGCSLLYITGVQ